MSLSEFGDIPLGPRELALRISGMSVAISGAIINVSGAVIEISGESLRALISGDTVIGLVSGQTVRALVSGDTVIGLVSGQTIRALVSGDAVFAYISGGNIIAHVSGDIVQISGQAVSVSGDVVNVSGAPVQEISATQVRARPGLAIASLSGGTVLQSGDCKNVVITNRSGNTDMYIGGTQGIDLPYSGNGILTVGGASISFDIANFNQVRVFATTSGQIVNYGGNQF